MYIGRSTLQKTRSTPPKNKSKQNTTESLKNPSDSHEESLKNLFRKPEDPLRIPKIP